ncbi:MULTISPECIES: helix-turn-helix domain-containing protein [Bacillus amyloliquefaciens group]|nr:MULTISPECIES: helix-turn-helix transcriptional regulator [Bacillus amyloliquefaciens group]UHH05102.1 helix-turn-helix domain-containing protein [Bacillus amyloliquefaciens]MCM3275591.1 helix-turn-helix domain-containing protein [Bacillus velezensis]MCM3348671.1 helix-turn-helix domain-containing protein [Bacillus velezensis]ULR24838.1 helix-turn-helix domain-containing protein [Bacillus velezensis]UQT50981.2 helix-turn-helix domain-containing protein [Bacillus velezensis]
MLADKSGYDKSHISKYVQGKQEMTLGTARTFAQILNCTIDDLYEWIPQE